MSNIQQPFWSPRKPSEQSCFSVWNMASLQPDVPFVLENRSIDYPRPIKVSFLSPHRYSQIICIGAGINGIITAIRFAQKIRNLSLVVYEKNADVGGTWFENTYPGVACDLPAHTYNLAFESKRDWQRRDATMSIWPILSRNVGFQWPICPSA
jgi:hypothetical protein